MQHTFVVKVLRRENATWQGVVKWIDQDGQSRDQSFRSALELIRLMDSAVGIQGGTAWEAAPE